VKIIVIYIDLFTFKLCKVLVLLLTVYFSAVASAR
jgi:hypothetical protein